MTKILKLLIGIKIQLMFNLCDNDYYKIKHKLLEIFCDYTDYTMLGNIIS